MIAKYKDNNYRYINSGEGFEIITKRREKTDSTFEKYRDVFHKVVKEDDDISAIFKVSIWIYYDIGFPGEPNYWRVTKENDGIKDGKIKLIHDGKYLPGWDIVDKELCIKYIRYSEVTSCIIKFSYKKKNGIILNRTEEEKIELPIEKLSEKLDEYDERNL